MLLTPIPAFMPASAVSTPLTIFGSSLKGWWKADAGITQSGGTVSAWADQSGNSYTFSQATSGNQGTFNASDLGSLPSITFDRTSSQFMEVASFTNGATKALAFFVGKIASVANFSRVLVFGDSGSDTVSTAGIFWYFPSGGSTTTIQQYNSGNVASNTIPGFNTGFQTFSEWDGTNGTISVGGSAGTPVASTPSFAATGILRLASNANVGTPDNCCSLTVSELGIVLGGTTSGQKTSLYSYLNGRYSV